MATTKEENKEQRSSNNDGPKSQLSSHPTGARNFSTPDDIAAGGGSRNYDADFGTLAQSERRDAERAQLNRQRHMTMKKEHAVRVGYRRAIKKKDGAGALALLNAAEKSGLNPFGLRAQGERNKAAYDAIASKQASEIRGGRRKYEPDKNYFQQSLVPPTGKPASTTPPGTAGTTPPGTAPIGTTGRGIGDYAADSIAGNTPPLNSPPGSAPGDTKSKEDEEKSKSTSIANYTKIWGPELAQFVDHLRDEEEEGLVPVNRTIKKVNDPDRRDSNDLFKSDSEFLRALSGVMGKDTRSDLAAYFKSLGPDLTQSKALKILEYLEEEGQIKVGNVPYGSPAFDDRNRALDGLLGDIQAAEDESFFNSGYGLETAGGFVGDQDVNKNTRLGLRKKLANMSDMINARNVTAPGEGASSGKRLEQAFEKLGIDPGKGFQVMDDRRERSDQALLSLQKLIPRLSELDPNRGDGEIFARENLDDAISRALDKRIQNSGVDEVSVRSNDPRLRPLLGDDRDNLLNAVRQNIRAFGESDGSNLGDFKSGNRYRNSSLFDSLGMDHVEGREMLLKMAQDSIKEQETAERNRTIL
tara:strand:- start:6238 stop:7989 length:1752 start_codon:yes stop_codon:yes gene_type:complete